MKTHMNLFDLKNNICCDDILQCVFNLNTLDFNVYQKLKEIGESRADILATEIKKERSTVYRSLQKLTCCGICKKITKTIPKGGYYHMYQCNDPKIIKSALDECIENWYTQMKKTLKNFDDL